jgi:indole-3-glycerol phosphate synthase
MSTEAEARVTWVSRPAPLSREHLVGVNGVLGRIVRERAEDYAGSPSGSTDLGPATDVPARPVYPSFQSALRRSTRPPADETPLAVIAEVKRASPSQGAIAELDPVAAAIAYAAGGAAALSVLTEPRHFGGDLQHLRAIAQALSPAPVPAPGLAPELAAGPASGRTRSPLPLLRKDFTVHPRQLDEAVAAGASAVLLMVSVLGAATVDYLAYATSLGLDALVEVHDDAELDVALAAGAGILGVNNRDLTSLQIDLSVAPRLLQRARVEGFTGVLVAESGYRTRDDLRAVEDLADAVLVGTSLAGSSDLKTALKTLRGAV